MRDVTSVVLLVLCIAVLLLLAVLNLRPSPVFLAFLVALLLLWLLVNRRR